MAKSNWKIYLSLVAIIILLSSGKGLLAQAAMIEKIEIDLDKRITVAGACNNGSLNVRIFSATSSQPFYTAGAACQENKFEFKDDLGYWQIPDGDYSIALMGEYDNLVNSSTAVFKIETIALPALGENIVEPAVESENSSISVQENEAVLENPSNGLFMGIINFLVEWFKSAVVMLKELVVEKVSTPELCLGNTCIIEDQLKDLLGGESPPPSISDVTTTASDIATTTN